VSGEGSFSAHLEKGKSVPEINFTNVNAAIGGDGALEGFSLYFGETGVSFAANQIKIGEHVSLSALKGSVASDALEVESAKISVVSDGKELVKTDIKNARLGDEGFTFDEISTSAADIDLGGFLTVKSTTLKLSDTAEKGFTAELLINNLSAKQELGGFFINASSISGSVIYTANSVTAKTESGMLEAGYLDIVKFGLTDISFADNVLTGSVATQKEGFSAKIFGDIITLGNAKLSAEKLSLGASGVRLSEGGKVTFSADYIGVLGTTVANPTLELTQEGFEGSAVLENQSISPVSGTVLTLNGKIGIEKKGSQQITPVTDNLNVDIGMFNDTVVLNARQISVGSGLLKAASVDGTINAAGTPVTLHSDNVSIDNSGAKAELFTAKIENSSLLGNALRIRQASVTAKNNFSDINAKGNIGLTLGDYSSDSIAMDVDFNRKNGFRPEFNRFELSMDILGASIKNLCVIKQENGEYDVSAKEISVSALSGAKLTQLHGRFSQSGLSMDEKAHFSMKKFADMKKDIEKDLPAFTIDENGLCFENTDLGTADIGLGGILSSTVKLSVGREAGKGLNITADINKCDIIASLGGFGVSANTIKGSIKYAEGRLSAVISGGDITANINDALSFKLGGISYSEEKGFIAENAEMLTKDFDTAGGMIKGSGLAITAKKLSVSAGGIGTEDGISGSMTHFGLLSAGLDNVLFTIKP
ncbi:MAG: hypothetical protein ACI4Q4_05585, partial [Oscillospiraceae bacterium]